MLRSAHTTFNGRPGDEEGGPVLDRKFTRHPAAEAAPSSRLPCRFGGLVRGPFTSL